MAHPVDLLVDGGFLLDIGVGARDVGLRLVVVVVGDEILDRVVREEGLELAIELGGQRLVGGEDERRALGRLDDVGHGEGLAGAGDAEQDLVVLVGAHAGDELGDGGRLVAARLVVGDDPERHAALGLLRPGRAMGHPVGGIVGDVERAAARQQRLDVLHRDGGGGAFGAGQVGALVALDARRARRAGGLGARGLREEVVEIEVFRLPCRVLGERSLGRFFHAGGAAVLLDGGASGHWRNMGGVRRVGEGGGLSSGHSPRKRESSDRQAGCSWQGWVPAFAGTNGGGGAVFRHAVRVPAPSRLPPRGGRGKRRGGLGLAQLAPGGV